jgi:hypothetical protein
MQPRTWVALAGVTVTGIAAVTTLVFALDASAADDRARSLRAEADAERSGACSPPLAAPSRTCAALEDAVDERIDAHRVANVALAITGVAALATAAVYLAWPESSQGATLSLGIEPSYAGNGSARVELRGRF